MKKALSLLLAVAMLSCFPACHTDGDDVSSGGGSSASSEGETMPVYRKVEEVKATFDATLADGTLVVYDDRTNELLKLKKGETAFTLLCQPAFTQGQITLATEMIPVSPVCVDLNGIHINCETGEACTGDRQSLSHFFSRQYEFGDTFSVAGDGESPSYTIPETYEPYGEYVASELFSGRYIASVYFKEADLEEGTAKYDVSFLVYDAREDTLSPVWKLGDEILMGDAFFFPTAGTRLMVDEWLADVSRMFEENYLPEPLKGNPDSVRREGDTVYFVDNQDLYAISPEGQLRLLYTYTADERVICEYRVTPEGNVYVLVDDEFRKRSRGALFSTDGCVYEQADILYDADDEHVVAGYEGKVYVDDQCVCEEAGILVRNEYDEIEGVTGGVLFADGQILIVKDKTKKLHLIPMP